MYLRDSGRIYQPIFVDASYELGLHMLVIGMVKNGKLVTLNLKTTKTIIWQIFDRFVVL